MNDDKPSEGARQKPWTSHAAKVLGTSESVVLVLIAVALVFVAVLLLYSSLYDLNEAVHHGEIENKAIQILNTVLLVMMTMEIVYTVAISLESHTLNAEPFLIIGMIAGIRRMLVITARDFRSLLRRVPSIQLKVLEALASRLPHEYG